MPALFSGGSPDGEGADDLIGGILILAAWFWPGADFMVSIRSEGQQLEEYVIKRKVGWPAERQILTQIVEDYGGDPQDRLGIALAWDGAVARAWSFPFPVRWIRFRDYPAEFVAKEQARLLDRYGIHAAANAPARGDTATGAGHATR